MTTILVKKEIDHKTDRAIHTILERFLTDRSDAGVWWHERRGIVLHYIPGATRDYLVGDDDNGREVIERIDEDMGLVEIEWERMWTVEGQNEPVVWIKEAGLNYLIEKEAERREASKPTDLDGLPF